MKMLMKTIIFNVALIASTLAIANVNHNVLLVILPGCHYCSEAENILDNSGIKYRTAVTNHGAVPKLYVDGKYKGTGVDAVQTWVEQNK